MLGYIEKFFPELVERIRRLPAAIKVALALVLALGPLVASRIPATFAAVASLLDQRYSVSGLVIILTALAFLMVVPAAHFLVTVLSRVDSFRQPLLSTLSADRSVSASRQELRLRLAGVARNRADAT